MKAAPWSFETAWLGVKASCKLVATFQPQTPSENRGLLVSNTVAAGWRLEAWLMGHAKKHEV
jgi:hypothetical protein